MKTSKKVTGHVQVPVCYRVVKAIKTDCGTSPVSIRSVCESFGMDYATQLAKLRSRSYTGRPLPILTEVANDGTCRDLAMIDVGSMIAWLMNSRPGEFAPEFRPVLVTMQDEDYGVVPCWHTTKDTAILLRSAPWSAGVKQLGRTWGRGSKKARLGIAHIRLLYVEPRIMFEPLARPLDQRRDLEYMTLREYCDLFGVTDDQKRPPSRELLAEFESMVEEMSTTLDMPVKKVQSQQALDLRPTGRIILNSTGSCLPFDPGSLDLEVNPM